MAQTLSAVAALVMLALFGISRQQALAADERADIGRAIEDAALQVSERWGGVVRDLAFDEADVASGAIRVQGAVTGLSKILGVDAGELASDPATFDDVDDVNGFSVGDEARAGDGRIAFRVSFSARYAAPETWAPAASPTTAKLITVVVEEANPTSGRPPVRVVTPIRVTSIKQSLHL